VRRVAQVGKGSGAQRRVESAAGDWMVGTFSRVGGIV